MKLVIKFGGTSISSGKNIKTVAKYLKSISKQNKIVTVCSAISGVTDELLEISVNIKKGNKENANRLVTKIINRHKQLAKDSISKSQTQKKLLEKLNADFSEFEELLHGLILLGEVTPRSLDYLISILNLGYKESITIRCNMKFMFYISIKIKFTLILVGLGIS